VKRRIKYGGLAVVAGVAVWFSYLLWRVHSYSHGYDLVARGDADSRVVRLLGQPLRTTGRPRHVAWDTDDSVHDNGGECVREFWYSPPINICGEAWTIGFDERGKVVSKYHYISP